MKKLHAIITFIDFNKTQRFALGLLLFMLFLFQFLIYYIPNQPPANQKVARWYYWSPDANESANANAKKAVSYPFNPNFISDYKAYTFGMTALQIERLRTYRQQNLYVNSPEEFQQITQVPDSILVAMRPYFKFPDWVTAQRKQKGYEKYKQFTIPVLKKDINTATAEDLIEINGIGEGLATRILNERQKFGFFVHMKQLDDIWGLSPAVLAQLHVYFEISTQPVTQKTNINHCNLKDLLHIPYVTYAVAKSIVMYRSKAPTPIQIEDLSKIDHFPVDKVDIIALYLEF